MWRLIDRLDRYNGRDGVPELWVLAVVQRAVLAGHLRHLGVPQDGAKRDAVDCGLGSVSRPRFYPLSGGALRQRLHVPRQPSVRAGVDLIDVWPLRSFLNRFPQLSVFAALRSSAATR